MKSKKKFSSEFKAKVAIEALKEQSTFTKENFDGFIIN